MWSPTSVLVGRGSIYVTNRGAAAAFTSQTSPVQHLGEVLRIPLDDDEEDPED